jgi:hypothetical protein
MSFFRDMAPELSVGFFLIFMSGAIFMTYMLSRLCYPVKNSKPGRVPGSLRLDNVCERMVADK